MNRLTPERAEAFILANTSLIAPPHVPEVRLHLADESHALWLKTEEELAEIGLPPPFWAFAWAGGQGLARYLLDSRDISRNRDISGLVAGKTVLDVAAGSGLVAIAAKMAGAAHVIANDIDPFCSAAVLLNGRANDVGIAFDGRDLVGTDEGWDVVLAGDVFYSKPMAEAFIDWFEALSSRGAAVLLGDPGRAYLPKQRLEPVAAYEVPVTRDLEDAEVKKTVVWRLAGRS